MAMIHGRAEAQGRLPSDGARIVDACAFITKWRPTRLGCYDMWQRLRPMIANADVRASCTASLQAAKAGRRLPAATSRQGEPPAARQRPAAKRETSATSRDNTTGETTTSVRNPDGSRTITRTDAASKVLSTEVVARRGAVEASSRDDAGNTTRSVRHADGWRTMTITDAAGNVISTEVRPPSTAAGANPAAPAPQPAAQVRPPTPAGVKTLPDFCAGIGNPVARTNCYGFGKMVKQLCNLMPPSRERTECKGITARIPERLGPFDG